MIGWLPIETAPKDGTRFYAKGYGYKGTRRLITWWGKASHVPMYGWCHGKVEETELWEPKYWCPIVEQSGDSRSE